MSKDNRKIVDTYGENVFNVNAMRNYLSDKAYSSLINTIYTGSDLDAGIADEVAEAMKSWALEKGASHFTHWFQPLTGTTAEKHDAFIMPDRQGRVIMQFSGKELVKGEPDASSFPSGGLRATFEARGYTAWDPSSPAFIKEVDNGAVLCIPTIFCSYHGDALDNKTPLLRSMGALSRQVCRLGKLFGIDVAGKRAYATLGAEQEYFLIDKQYYDQRFDLVQTGRTLFGRRPPKHQQMEDHYFGAIKTRIMKFMNDLDCELWRLGVPAKTRHNEVAPAQFEVAPLFEEINLAIDHNMVMMNVLREVAERHGLVCLLHEKPFAGVNGSGKHNNWSVCGPDGKNWLTPGDSPHENAKFLTMVCALLKAVDTHADLLRAAVASAGNDHRLGANEAPPAIISVFLGEQLTDIFEQLERGVPKSSKAGGTIQVGVSSLPILPRDATDRNRTSPFAFTGNKFEFRAVGSSMSCANANIVLNTIVAEALDAICTQLEADLEKGREFNPALQKVLQKIVVDHKRIIFNGDNYTKAWHDEAADRGLPNLRNTPEALKAMVSKKAVQLFTRYSVLSERELHSRYEVYQHTYERVVLFEAECAAGIARTQIAPAAISYQADLARAIHSLEEAGAGEPAAIRELLNEVNAQTDHLLASTKRLEKTFKAGYKPSLLDEMVSLRQAADALEGMLPEQVWPLPSYAEMLFMM